MGDILYTILIGAIVGVLARTFKPGADPLGWVLTILLGIAGAYIGSLLYVAGGLVGFAVSIACAIALLFVYERIRKKISKT